MAWVYKCIYIYFSGRNEQRELVQIVRGWGDDHPPRRPVGIGPRGRTLLLRQMDPEEVLQGQPSSGRRRPTDDDDGSALRKHSRDSPAQDAVSLVPKEGQRCRLRRRGRDERTQGRQIRLKEIAYHKYTLRPWLNYLKMKLISKYS